MQLLDDCILRLSEQTSIIVGYVKKANDFSNGLRQSHKCLPMVIVAQWRTKIMRTGFRITPHDWMGERITMDLFAEDFLVKCLWHFSVPKCTGDLKE